VIQGRGTRENIWGQDKKVDDFFSRRPQNTGQNYRINHPNSPKNASLYNCLLFFTIAYCCRNQRFGGGGQGSVGGWQLPPSSPAPSKTAPGVILQQNNYIYIKRALITLFSSWY